MMLFSDPYVKVWLHVGDKKVEKRKSMVFKCNLNPIFDEKFEYTLPVEQLREAALEVMVMDFDNIGRNELIGKITISCECVRQSNIRSLTMSGKYYLILN